jgi:hypothetical protein
VGFPERTVQLQGFDRGALCFGQRFLGRHLRILPVSMALATLF